MNNALQQKWVLTFQVKRWASAWLLVLFTVVLGGCATIPDGIEPVKKFDIDRYLATYTLNDDGSVKVLNRGYKLESKEWKSADLLAKLVDDSGTGHFKVAFIRPFYASYIVFELDEDYQYAFVTGNKRKYLWLLAREPFPPEEVLQRFKQSATELGFDLDKLKVDIQREDLPR